MARSTIHLAAGRVLPQLLFAALVTTSGCSKLMLREISLPLEVDRRHPAARAKSVSRDSRQTGFSTQLSALTRRQAATRPASQYSISLDRPTPRTPQRYSLMGLETSQSAAARMRHQEG